MDIVTDFAVGKNWFCFKNGNNEWTITCKNSDNSAFDLTGYVFTVYIRTHFGTVNRLTLTEGDGITNGGVSGLITLTLTQEQAGTTLPRDLYYWELDYVVNGLTYRLYYGNLYLNAQENPGNQSISSSQTVSLAGTQIVAYLTVGGLTSGSISATLGYTPVDPDDIIVNVSSDIISEFGPQTEAFEDRVETDGGVFEGGDSLDSLIDALTNIDLS